MSWIKPNTITGPTAEGSKYFKREDKENKIWRKILTNHHILFLAPRRVGKSSIVINMTKNPREGFACLYENIASEGSLQDFYRRLYEMTVSSLNAYQKTKNKVFSWLKSIKITSVSADGVVTISSSTFDYREEFIKLLNSIPTGEVKVVLFLDEFPDVVLKVFKNKGIEEAEKLLADIRNFDREEFKRVFMMVLLGSVGLNHVIKQITGRTDKVNNLHKEYLQALSSTEVSEFIRFLCDGATMQIDKEANAYFIQKTGHHIPFYLQLIIEECDEILENNNTPNLSREVIDLACMQLISKNEHFSDWDSRLSQYFPAKYAFLLAVLTNCAHNGTISLQEIANISKKHKNVSEWKADIDDVLIADGYLFEKENAYSFNSPLLRDWWKNRHPNIK
jgi:uncharacterized protein